MLENINLEKFGSMRPSWRFVSIRLGKGTGYSVVLGFMCRDTFSFRKPEIEGLIDGMNAEQSVRGSKRYFLMVTQLAQLSSKM